MEVSQLQKPHLLLLIQGFVAVCYYVYKFVRYKKIIRFK